MTRAAALIALLLAAIFAAGAQAQPRTVDPIDALLRPLAKDADVEEPDTASTGSAVVEPDPDLPPTPQAYRAYAPPPRPVLTAPVFLNETGKNPDGPVTPAQAAYDSRLRSSAASVQGFQGPMDGGWTLSAAGQPLYAFELADRNGLVEGAWRDLRRPGASDAWGFFDVVEHTDGELRLHFTDQVVAVLHAKGGRWAGELTEGGRREQVSLARRGP